MVYKYGIETRTQLLKKLKNKAVRIVCFKSKLEPAKPLYRDSQNKRSIKSY